MELNVNLDEKMILLIVSGALVLLNLIVLIVLLCKNGKGKELADLNRAQSELAGE